MFLENSATKHLKEIQRIYDNVMLPPVADIVSASVSPNIQLYEPKCNISRIINQESFKIHTVATRIANIVASGVAHITSSGVIDKVNLGMVEKVSLGIASNVFLGRVGEVSLGIADKISSGAIGTLPSNVADTAVITAAKSTTIDAINRFNTTANLMHSEKLFPMFSGLKNPAYFINEVFVGAATNAAANAVVNITKDYAGIFKKLDFDLGAIILEDEEVTLDNEKYSVGDTQAEILSEAKKVQALGDKIKSLSLDTFKQKFPVICIIVQIMLSIPTIHSAIEFYDDLFDNVIYPIISFIADSPCIKYVIKDQAYIRKSPDSKSKCIVAVLYAEPVEILENTNYWYKVKYLKEDKVFIGWISKISVGL